MIDPMIHHFDDKQIVAKEVNKFIILHIDQCFNKFSQIMVLLSGGNTPRELYEFMAANIHYQNLIYLQIDERWVTRDSDRSNQTMIRKIFANNANFFPIGTPDDYVNVNQASEEYHRFIESQIVGNQCIIGIFGMGEDGHTASLFPNVFDPNQLGNQLVTSYFVPAQDENRISITPKMISKMDTRILLISGKSKGITLAKALKSKNLIFYPVLILFTSDCNVFMDAEAYDGYLSEI